MGGRDHSCEVCGRGGFNDPDGACICEDESIFTSICGGAYGEVSREFTVEKEGNPWPSFVRIEWDENNSSVVSDDARRFARMILAAADACDENDGTRADPTPPEPSGEGAEPKSVVTRPEGEERVWTITAEAGRLVKLSGPTVTDPITVCPLSRAEEAERRADKGWEWADAAEESRERLLAHLRVLISALGKDRARRLIDPLPPPTSTPIESLRAERDHLQARVEKLRGELMRAAKEACEDSDHRSALLRSLRIGKPIEPGPIDYGYALGLDDAADRLTSLLSTPEDGG